MRFYRYGCIAYDKYLQQSVLISFKHIQRLPTDLRKAGCDNKGDQYKYNQPTP